MLLHFQKDMLIKIKINFIKEPKTQGMNESTKKVDGYNYKSSQISKKQVLVKISFHAKKVI